MSLCGNGIRNLIRNPRASCSRSEYHNANILHLDLADLQRSGHGSQGDTPGTLDIVIEARNFRLVFIQDSPSVLQPKVLASPVRGKVQTKIDGWIMVIRTSGCKPWEIAFVQLEQIVLRSRRTPCLGPGAAGGRDTGCLSAVFRSGELISWFNVFELYRGCVSYIRPAIKHHRELS